MNSNSIKVGGIAIDLSFPAVMGIINVTPDSFSDGGNLRADGETCRFQVSLDKVLEQASRMLEEGAAILDIGGESTRPGAAPLSEQEELDRVIPVVQAICSRLPVAVSVDTSTPSVMKAAISAGAGLINDVRALQRPGALTALVLEDVAICLMHMQGEPGTMQDSVRYESVVDEVMAFLSARIDACERAGISRDRLIVDPGFGFGKTAEHNYVLLQQLARLQIFGLPILVGLSRKSMLGAVTGRSVGQRVSAGVAATTHALLAGATIIRTHDVAATVDAIKVHCAIQGAR